MQMLVAFYFGRQSKVACLGGIAHFSVRTETESGKSVQPFNLTLRAPWSAPNNVEIDGLHQTSLEVGVCNPPSLEFDGLQAKKSLELHFLHIKNA